MFELIWKFNVLLLYVVVFYGFFDILQGLIINGVDVNERIEDGFLVYYRVVRNFDDVVLRVFL